MMSPIQLAKANRDKKLFIGIGIIVAGLWIALVMYLLADSRNVHVTMQPSTVTVRSASPVATVSTPTTHFRHSTPMLQHHSIPVSPQWSMPSPTPMSGTSSMRIHQTSNAVVHTVGGGGSGSGITTTSGHSSQGKGIAYTSIAYSGAIYVPVVSNAITPVGAQEASDVSQQKLGAPQRRPRTANDGEYPEDRPDPVPDETPVGDVAWVLMVLLTIGWCVRVRLKKQ